LAWHAVAHGERSGGRRTLGCQVVGHGRPVWIHRASPPSSSFTGSSGKCRQIASRSDGVGSARAAPRLSLSYTIASMHPFCDMFFVPSPRPLSLWSWTQGIFVPIQYDIHPYFFLSHQCGPALRDPTTAAVLAPSFLRPSSPLTSPSVPSSLPAPSFLSSF
jgi:hypothetical protein